MTIRLMCRGGTAAAVWSCAVLLVACSPSDGQRTTGRQGGSAPEGSSEAAPLAARLSEGASSRKLYFGFDRVDLQPEHGPVIETVAAAAMPSGRVVRLESFCESPCSTEQAEASAKRAHAVAAALERLGVRAACILSEAGRVDGALAADEDGRAEARSVRMVVGETQGDCSGDGAGNRPEQGQGRG